MHLFGHEYVGPGTNLEQADEPIDVDDYLAKEHDIAYAQASSSQDIHNADANTINDIMQDPMWFTDSHKVMMVMGLGSKFGLEHLGVNLYNPVNPDSLSTQSETSKGRMATKRKAAADHEGPASKYAIQDSEVSSSSINAMVATENGAAAAAGPGGKPWNLFNYMRCEDEVYKLTFMNRIIVNHGVLLPSGNYALSNNATIICIPTNILQSYLYNTSGASSFSRKWTGAVTGSSSIRFLRAKTRLSNLILLNDQLTVTAGTVSTETEFSGMGYVMVGRDRTNYVGTIKATDMLKDAEGTTAAVWDYGDLYEGGYFKTDADFMNSKMGEVQLWKPNDEPIEEIIEFNDCFFESDELNTGTLPTNITYLPNQDIYHSTFKQNGAASHVTSYNTTSPLYLSVPAVATAAKSYYKYRLHFIIERELQVLCKPYSTSSLNKSAFLRKLVSVADLKNGFVPYATDIRLPKHQAVMPPMQGQA